MKIKTNLVGGILFVILSTIVWILIPYQIPTFAGDAVGVGSRYVPKLITGVMFVCGALLVIQSLVFKKENIVTIDLKKDEINALLMGVIMIVYLLLILKVGFLIASIFVAVATVLYFRSRTWWHYVLVGSFSVVIYLIFTLVFKVNLS